MRFDSRNLLIAVMFLIILALMGLVYKVNTLVVDRIPQRIEPEVYVMGLTEAIERQNLLLGDLAHQNRWLRLHLDKCLTLIESQRGLEPIPVKLDKSKDPFIGMMFEGDRAGPFVRPFEKYIPPEQEEPMEKNLKTLECLTNLATLGAQMAGGPYETEAVISNLQQRLERIAPDPNQVQQNPQMY